MAHRLSPPATLPEVIVSKPAALAECLACLQQAPVIGLDTEFIAENAYRPELCLVQAATAEQLFVIDPFTCGSLEPFWSLLLEPSRTLVVHAGREDLRICQQAVGQFPPNVFDVQVAAGMVGMTYPISYSAMVNELFGQRMVKGETLTNWRRRPLLPEQLRYAFDDIRFLIPAWTILAEKLRKLNREAWAAEEFQNVHARVVRDEPPTEKWRKLKGLGALDRRGLAIARELYLWREDYAQEADRPPRAILRDDLIAEIARRAPKRVDQLRILRGFSTHMAEAILQAVERGRELPLEECPPLHERETDLPHVGLLTNLLGVVVTSRCSELRISAGLAATQQELKTLVRQHVAHRPLPDITLTRGWRASALLPDLLAVLRGEKAVCVLNPPGSTSSPIHLAPMNRDGSSLPGLAGENSHSSPSSDVLPGTAQS